MADTALSARLEIRLKPRAKNDRVTVSGSNTLSIAVTSPPLEGKANEHLIRLLSKKLGVPKSSFTILRGDHSKNKVVAIEGITAEEAMKKIAD